MITVISQQLGILLGIRQIRQHFHYMMCVSYMTLSTLSDSVYFPSCQDIA